MTAKPLQTDEPAVTAEQCRALVERVASSMELRRAARLRAFLLYVCDQTLRHGVTVIHEQEIGAAVFERSKKYDTSVDNIVRVNATELRKRLEHFFADEGREEELILEIQRGSYTPTFHRRAVDKSAKPLTLDNASAQQTSLPDTAPSDTMPQSLVSPSTTPAGSAAAAAVAADVPEGASPDVEPVAEVPAAPPKVERVRVWQGLCGLLLIGCAALAWQLHSLSRKGQPWAGDPAISTFWDQFLYATNDTDILLADTSFALAEDIMHRKIALPDYLNYNYKHMAEDPALSEVQRNDLALVLERNNGSIADFQVGAQILSLDRDRHRFTLEFARSYSPEAAKHHSLVLIGSRESNPWVSLFANKMNFDLEYDSAARRPYVVNRAPQAGEAAQYPAAAGTDAVGTGYAVIGFMPDLSGKGKALIIEGTDSQATGAAGDFMTSEDGLTELEKMFPAGTVPYFEVMLRTSQLHGTPLHGEVIAYRVYPAGRSR